MDTDTDADVRPDAQDTSDVTDTGDASDADVAEDTDTDVGPIGDFTVIDCESDIPTPTEGQLCVVSVGDGGIVLLEGRVLGPEAVYEGGQVLISDDGNILCVGCGCDTDPQAVSATVVSCADGVISPGLINTHEHLDFAQNGPGRWGRERYDHRHEWRLGLNGHTRIDAIGSATTDQQLWGEMRHIMSGTTSVVGDGGGAGLLRNINDITQHEGLESQGAVQSSSYPLGDSAGSILMAGCGYPGGDDESVLTDNHAYHAHIAEGVSLGARNEFFCANSNDDGAVDLTGSNASFVHAIALRAADGQELAANGTAVIWSPRSNISLYGHTAPVTMFATQGVDIALGTDWAISGSMNMQRELACAASLNDVYFDGYFSNRELVEMATVHAAAAIGIDDVVGTLADGYVADIAIFNGNGNADPYRAIIEANVADTTLVIRGGVPLYGDSEIMNVIPNGQLDCESIPGDVCGVPKTACVMREIGVSFSQFQSNNSGSYALYSCGAPGDEPTCVPTRDGEYNGVPRALDNDGDGIEPPFDNCPNVFNPIRPVDRGNQADADADGIGDVCDPCPLTEGDVCAAYDADDRDADGVPNLDDNCPYDPNADQDDVDLDDTGDVCDRCPLIANPGDSLCRYSIYDIKEGVIAVGTVTTVGGVVTATNGTQFFIQVPQTDEDYDGAAFSGLFVDFPDDAAGLTVPAVGDIVAVSGTVQDFSGQIRLTEISTLSVESIGNELPAPEPVPPGDVATDGPLADDYEGVLVAVRNVEVTFVNPPAGEYIIDGSLLVNDFIAVTMPFPVVGDALNITGVLRFEDGVSKLEMTLYEFDTSDWPLLASMEPGLVFFEQGLSDASSVPELVVTLDRTAGRATTVSFESSDVSLSAADVIIAAGELTGVVLMTGSAPSATHTLSATLNGSQISTEVRIIGMADSPVPVAVNTPIIIDNPGGDAVATVALDFPAFGGATLNVTSGDPTIAAADATVPVANLASFVDVTITGVAPGTTMVSFEIGGTTVSTMVTVEGPPPLGLIISEVFYHPIGNTDELEWVELYNASDSPIDLSGYVLGAGGNTYTNSTAALTGTLSPSECFVIGGPNSSADNAMPIFNLAIDFDPDLQNGGSAADGIGLFESPLTNGSIPIDVVLYNGDNVNALIGTDGLPVPAVDIAPDSGTGGSIYRNSSGDWAATDMPSPGNCAHVTTP